MYIPTTRATAMNSTPEKPQGLSAAEVADRAARGLVNRVHRSALAEYLAIVRRNLFTIFNALVAPAALLLFLLGGPDNLRDAITVSGMIVANTLLGLAQEIRAKWHLDHLAILADTKVRVLRDEVETVVPTGDVVQGDCVLVAAGESIVADGPLLVAHFLEVDEALLTGESDSVHRRAGETVLSGSFCVAGEGWYRAERIGEEAFAQRTAAEARAYRRSTSPKCKRRSIESWRFALYAAPRVRGLVCALADRRGWFIPEARSWLHFPNAALLRMIAATITSLVPQGLVLMATLAFTLGRHAVGSGRGGDRATAQRR